MSGHTSYYIESTSEPAAFYSVYRDDEWVFTSTSRITAENEAIRWKEKHPKSEVFVEVTITRRDSVRELP